MTWQTDAPIGELANGECSRWYVGVCMIRALNDEREEVAGSMQEIPRYIEVLGERDNVLALYDIEEKDIDEIDRLANTEIEHEQNRL